MQVAVRFCSIPPQIRGRKSGRERQWPPTSLLLPPTTRKGLAVRWLLGVPPCHKSTIHLQTSMSSPGFEPSPYGTTVSVANHYAGWVTSLNIHYR
ncbi:hypothetical protein TNCV_2874111 [Trichonephila clavipes]|nr:hypothetical protein TNCV_2874111 [Trichonephila clavipes]